MILQFRTWISVHGTWIFPFKFVGFSLVDPVSKFSILQNVTFGGMRRYLYVSKAGLSILKFNDLSLLSFVEKRLYLDWKVCSFYNFVWINCTLIIVSRGKALEEAQWIEFDCITFLYVWDFHILISKIMQVDHAWCTWQILVKAFVFDRKSIGKFTRPCTSVELHPLILPPPPSLPSINHRYPCVLWTRCAVKRSRILGIKRFKICEIWSEGICRNSASRMENETNCTVTYGTVLYFIKLPRIEILIILISEIL